LIDSTKVMMLMHRNTVAIVPKL